MESKLPQLYFPLRKSYKPLPKQDKYVSVKFSVISRESLPFLKLHENDGNVKMQNFKVKNVKNK